jgi:collagenase-like PrtC family protease
VDALEHLGQAVAEDEADRVDGGEIKAFGAIERFAALEDEPFLKLQNLIQGHGRDVELVVVELLHNADEVAQAGAWR